MDSWQSPSDPAFTKKTPSGASPTQTALEPRRGHHSIVAAAPHAKPSRAAEKYPNDLVDPHVWPQLGQVWTAGRWLECGHPKLREFGLGRVGSDHSAGLSEMSV